MKMYSAVEVELLISLTSGLDKSEFSASCLGCFNLGRIAPVIQTIRQGQSQSQSRCSGKEKISWPCGE
jgi:hypothetical protein